jgi:hypothetical protein
MTSILDDLMPYADVVLEVLKRTPPPTTAELADELNELSWPGDIRLNDPAAVAGVILSWWERESTSASTADVAAEQSHVTQEQETPAAVTLPVEIASVCRNSTNGTPTTFMCYGSDEALFMARLKPFSAYAATRDGKFTVVGVRDDTNKDFMIACTGSKSEDAAFSAASCSGGAVDRLDRELLTEAELKLRRPVDAYSNFAQPGCDLMSLDGFNRRLTNLRSGRYTVVKPSIKSPGPASTPSAAQQTTHNIPAAKKTVDPASQVVHCTSTSCEKDWKISELQEVEIDGDVIKWVCPKCGRRRMTQV